MQLFDRRFLDVSLTVQGIANEPAENPALGTQYIVGENPTGAFASATANKIARYDGSKWRFTTPKAGRLEVLNASTSEILRFNGTEWEAVAYTGGEAVLPVINIVPTGTTLPATASVGDKFLKTDDAKLYTANAVNTWGTGVLTANGDRYASSTDFKIYQSDGEKVEGETVAQGASFLNKADNYLYVYDTDFVRASTDKAKIVETHTLTAAEATAKSFNLANAIKSGEETNIMLFLNGMPQIAGTDFTASGSTISWNGKNLDSEIGLIEDDVFIIHYVKA